jgi:hypothetical protein
MNKKQLEIGIKRESDEHGLGEALSKKIAMDHLREIPDYYDRLDEMEREAEEGDDKDEGEEEKKGMKTKGY